MARPRRHQVFPELLMFPFLAQSGVTDLEYERPLCPEPPSTFLSELQRLIATYKNVTPRFQPEIAAFIDNMLERFHCSSIPKIHGAHLLDDLEIYLKVKEGPVNGGVPSEQTGRLIEDNICEIFAKNGYPVPIFIGS
ncbi:MAG: hypothetical protein Q9208_001253 [Pyrenodesmia sp. 3 TL-2023]